MTAEAHARPGSLYRDFLKQYFSNFEDNWWEFSCSLKEGHETDSFHKNVLPRCRLDLQAQMAVLWGC